MLFLVLYFAFALIVEGSVGCDTAISQLAAAWSATHPGQSAAASDMSGQLYYYNPCNVAVSGENAAGCPANAIVCQESTNGYYSTGNTASISAGPSSEVLTLTNGMGGRQASVTLTCSPNAGLGEFTFVSESPNLTYNFEWTSANLCVAPVANNATLCTYLTSSNAVELICSGQKATCPNVDGLDFMGSKPASSCLGCESSIKNRANIVCTYVDNATYEASFLCASASNYCPQISGMTLMGNFTTSTSCTTCFQ